MRKLVVITLVLAFSTLTLAQKYVFDNRAVYVGTGLFQNTPKYGKYILYWSSEKQIIGLEIFDNEGSFVSMTIFDPQANKLIALDEREKTGFIVNYSDYATKQLSNETLDTSSLTGTDEINGKICRKYKHTLANGQTVNICIINAFFDSALLKFLDKTGYTFMPVPYGFKGIIAKYELTDNQGNKISSLNLQELAQDKFYIFDLSKYYIQQL